MYLVAWPQSMGLDRHKWRPCVPIRYLEVGGDWRAFWTFWGCLSSLGHLFCSICNQKVSYKSWVGQPAVAGKLWSATVAGKCCVITPCSSVLKHCCSKITSRSWSPVPEPPPWKVLVDLGIGRQYATFFVCRLCIISVEWLSCHSYLWEREVLA